MDHNPGFKTSEFWLRVLALGLGAAAFLLGAMQQSPLVAALGMIVGGAVKLLALKGYSSERTALKLADLNAKKDLLLAGAADPQQPPQQ